VGARIARPKKSLDKLKGLLKVRRKLPLLIAIPTTAGTGSEVTVASVITDSDTHHKYTILDFNLIPEIAVLDPSCTLSLPPHLTSTTGMDALTHAVEAYIGRSTTKDTRKKAIEAIKLIFNNIEKVYNNGNDLDARLNMLKASYLAGSAFSKSYVGYVHAVAHSLGGQYNIPHGLANAVILPIVLKEYGSSVYKKLDFLAKQVGISNKDESKEIGANKFIDAILSLNNKMNIPNAIKNIKDEDIELMAEYAEKEANPLYPVPKLLNKEELKKIYYKLKN
jgi:alcohol dehydrogenase class IV